MPLNIWPSTFFRAFPDMAQSPSISSSSIPSMSFILMWRTTRGLLPAPIWKFPRPFFTHALSKNHTIPLTCPFFRVLSLYGTIEIQVLESGWQCVDYCPLVSISFVWKQCVVLIYAAASRTSDTVLRNSMSISLWTITNLQSLHLTTTQLCLFLVMVQVSVPLPFVCSHPVLFSQSLCIIFILFLAKP